MRVLVTGAGGFVGGVVARRLAGRGHQVTALYRNSVPARLDGVDGVRLLRADLRDLGELTALDGLVHCAADVPALCPEKDELVRSNVEGTRQLFAAARAAGAARIIYLSSMSIYGTINVPVLDESYQPHEPDHYGRSKLEGETLLEALCASAPTVGGLAIRLPGVVGAGARNNFLSGSLGRILRGEPVRAVHPNAVFNNIVHVEDLAGFIAEKLPSLPPGFAVSNIAARNAVALREVLELLYSAAGKTPNVQWGTEGKPPFTISLARIEQLGFTPASVRDSVERYVRDELRARG